MTDLIQPIVNGILLGGLYAAVAIGLSLMFGIVRLINLAHGDLMITASYLSLVMVEQVGLSPLTAAVMVVPMLFPAGFGLQKYVLNRALRRGPEPPIIVALGISIVLQNVLLLIFSPDARSIPANVAVLAVPVTENLSLPVIYLMGFGVGCTAIAAVHVLVRRTRLGRAIRAASEDDETARLMGIDTEYVHCCAMGIAVTTAAVAGVLVGMTFTFYPHSGPQYLLIAFGVIVIGGVGSMTGALAGGIVLGLAQLVGAHVFGPGHQLLCGYLVLLAVLAVRPHGILGRANS
ncbi:MAG: branched-chain amino acid ABC transporter permease [Desulfomonilaceae bacterium]|nr:branched-chain amino acid ABC transporter permease [Desulfomonilaceae bacterium]